MEEGIAVFGQAKSLQGLKARWQLFARRRMGDHDCVWPGKNRRLNPLECRQTQIAVVGRAEENEVESRVGKTPGNEDFAGVAVNRCGRPLVDVQ